jgi:hypothetical protein
MTLNEFLKDKTLEAVELIDFDYNQVINVYVDGGAGYGLAIDTSNVPSINLYVSPTLFVISKS